jgi:hypothetical protein
MSCDIPNLLQPLNIEGNFSELIVGTTLFILLLIIHVYIVRQAIFRLFIVTIVRYRLHQLIIFMVIWTF